MLGWVHYRIISMYRTSMVFYIIQRGALCGYVLLILNLYPCTFYCLTPSIYHIYQSVWHMGLARAEVITTILLTYSLACNRRSLTSYCLGVCYVLDIRKKYKNKLNLIFFCYWHIIIQIFRHPYHLQWSWLHRMVVVMLGLIAVLLSRYKG